MGKLNKALLLFGLFISACTSIDAVVAQYPIGVATKTNTPTSTLTPFPTSTFLPSETPTLTTTTPTATSTPIFTVTLSNRQEDEQQLEVIIKKLINDWNQDSFPSDWAEYTTAYYREAYIYPAPNKGIFDNSQEFIDFWSKSNRRIMNKISFSWRTDTPDWVLVNVPIIYGEGEQSPTQSCIYYFEAIRVIENNISHWYINADKSINIGGAFQVCPK